MKPIVSAMDAPIVYEIRDVNNRLFEKWRDPAKVFWMTYCRMNLIVKTRQNEIY